jgi:hypothetical protein
LTLAELLVASTIMLLIATAVATLAATVQSTNDYCKGHTVSAQHARVALSRKLLFDRVDLDRLIDTAKEQP